MFMKCILYTKSFKLQKELLFLKEGERAETLEHWKRFPGERFEITSWIELESTKQVCKHLRAQEINSSEMWVNEIIWEKMFNDFPIDSDLTTFWILNKKHATKPWEFSQRCLNQLHKKLFSDFVRSCEELLLFLGGGDCFTKSKNVRKENCAR